MKGSCFCLVILLGLAGCRKNDAAAPAGREGAAMNTPGPPFAKPVQGQRGFVISPFSRKMVDVRGLPSGAKVLDPEYPKEQKKYFRVP